MYENICRRLIISGAEILYSASRPIGLALERIAEKGGGNFQHEVLANEAGALKSALRAGCAGSRTACIFPMEGLYDALDPLANSAASQIAGGLVIVSIRETDADVGPLALMAGIPLIASEDAESFARSVQFGYGISESYGLPVILQTTPDADAESPESQVPSPKSEAGKGQSGHPDPRPPTPDPRSNRLELIRQEFESYEGNRVTFRGTMGLITDRRESLDLYGDDLSLLHLSTLFPLPRELVRSFTDRMEEVFLAEGPYPVIELQIEDRSKVMAERPGVAPGRKKSPEMMYGFRVVRDNLGAASSINVAQGMKKADPEARLLAVTFEDHFFHSGLAAIVNALRAGLSFVVLILGGRREHEVRDALDAIGFEKTFQINDPSELERYGDRPGLTVLFYRGIL